MRRADQVKQNGIITSTKRDVDTLKQNQSIHSKEDTSLSSGSCIVQDVTAYGTGSICEVEVLSNGLACGLRYTDAICHSALLTMGSVVQFIKRPDGSIELVSGGGSAGPTTNNITQNVTSFDGAFMFYTGFSKG